MLYNEEMMWVRKGLVQVLAFLLLVALLSGTVAVSANLALSRPTKLEGWLQASKLYDHFVANAIAQVQQITSNNTGSNGIPLNDPAVQQAAEAAFPPQLIQHSVNTFLDSNYAWLQGKTSQPNFVIDLTAARQSFAQQVGQDATTRLTGLPSCTALQEAQLPNPSDIDALSIDCRPIGVNPAAAGAQVTHKIVTSDSFLSKPVITARTINPKDDKGGSRPYYDKLSKAPELYRLGQKLPFIFGALALLSTVGIIFIAPTRRRGTRRVGVVLATAGLLLLLTTFVVHLAAQRIEGRVFNNKSIGQLQQSLLDFAHRVQHQIVSVDLCIAVAFLIAAAVIFIGLMRTRTRQVTNKSPLAAAGPPVAKAEAPESGAAPANSQRVQLAARPRVAIPDVQPLRPQPSGPPPVKRPSPERPSPVTKPATKPARRPRLIQ